jgi:Holliday junction resolvase RusA-like endonuclease
MQIIILGQVPAQKNAKKMNTRTKTLYSEKRVKEWQQSAHDQLTTQYKGQCEGRAGIAYMFYVKDDRRRDWDNMVASVNDALVKAGLLADDSWQACYCCGVDCEIDKDNPRVELWVIDDTE